MKHVSVASSNVESVAHDPTSKKLQVRFKDGRLYEYSDMDAAKHQSLLNAPSIGSFIKGQMNEHDLKRVE